MKVRNSSGAPATGKAQLTKKEKERADGRGLGPGYRHLADTVRPTLQFISPANSAPGWIGSIENRNFGGC